MGNFILNHDHTSIYRWIENYPANVHACRLRFFYHYPWVLLIFSPKTLQKLFFRVYIHYTCNSQNQRNLSHCPISTEKKSPTILLRQVQQLLAEGQIVLFHSF